MKPADMTVPQIRELLAECPAEELPRLLKRLRSDRREGVKALVALFGARCDRVAREQGRLAALFVAENALRAKGARLVAGIDEVGRGALAGPVTACAVVFEAECHIPDLNDSKALIPEVRERVATDVRRIALAWAVGHAPSEEIDRLGIGPATRLAWRRALDGLALTVDHVLVDGNDAGSLGVETTAVVRGDSAVACIAAASVVAKVERDRLMALLALEHPGYGFESNRGYGTTEHVEAIRTLGTCPVHRSSFAPCQPMDTLF